MGNGQTKKRKASPTDSRDAIDDTLLELARKLDHSCKKLAVSLREKAFNQHEVTNEENLTKLQEAVEAVVAFSWTPSTRLARLAQEVAGKPETAEASTDTCLTPHWWSTSDACTEDTSLADLHRFRVTSGVASRLAPLTPSPPWAHTSYASVVGGSGPSGTTDHAMDTGSSKHQMTQRGPRQSSAAHVAVRPKRSKPPAVLVQTADGKSFEDILKAIKDAVDPGALGVDVRRLSKTQGRHLLVELSGGTKAAADVRPFRGQCGTGPANSPVVSSHWGHFSRSR